MPMNTNPRLPAGDLQDNYERAQAQTEESRYKPGTVAVPQEIIDQIMQMGMESALALVRSGRATPEMNEAVVRFYQGTGKAAVEEGVRNRQEQSDSYIPRSERTSPSPAQENNQGTQQTNQNNSSSRPNRVLPNSTGNVQLGLAGFGGAQAANYLPAEAQNKNRQIQLKSRDIPAPQRAQIPTNINKITRETPKQSTNVIPKGNVSNEEIGRAILRLLSLSSV